jgi:alpha-beta hydrolase superfamily lysophospholipase
MVAYAAPMPSIVSHVAAADGTDLLVRHWPADEAEAGGAWAGAPWGSVLLVHGLWEHSGRYEHVGDQLSAAGLETWGYDHRGMGGSGGRRGDIERWSQLHDDLAERLAAVRSASPGRPVVIYGHSLGGLISAGYLLTDRPKPDLAVLSAPALGDSIPAWKRSLVGVAARVRPTFDIPADLDDTTLSRDPSVAAKTVDDPFCVKTNTARFAVAAFHEQARVLGAVAGGFGLPTLVLHGEDDRLVPTDASAILATVPGVERRTFPELRHELHNEPEGPAIVDDVIAWLRQKCG